MPPATIRDVAARARVSVATVSRVFNQKKVVRPETVRRVLDVARALRYVPNAVARSLSTRSTNTIGVVLPDLHGEFFSEVIRGIDIAARQKGFHLLVSGSHADRTEMHAVLQAVRGRVDGVIVMSPDLDSSALLGDLPSDVPVVLLNSRVGGRASITIDNFAGARAVVRHLTGLGHRRIAFIGGPPQNVDAEERRRGFREALQAAGIPANRVLEMPGDFTEGSGHDAAKKIVARTPRPTAIFAANDAMAIGALSAIRSARLRVPDDISLVGFDDIPISRFLTPALTTVEVPMAELGRRGFDLLLSARNSEGKVQTARVKTSLVVRQSTGAPQRLPRIRKARALRQEERT